jgi:sugar phosphate isomerase/epimerase
MYTPLNRRRFLAAGSVAAALAATPAISNATTLGASAFNGLVADDKPIYDISLAQWSLHRTIRKGEIDNLDFAKVTKEKFDITAVEYVNQFFKDKAEDESYLGEMKKRCEDLGVESVLIMIDGEGQLGNADEGARKKAVENHHKWVTAAKFLGCHSIRVNAASSGSYSEQVERAADGLRSLCEFATDHDINVIVENHGGLSSNGQWLAQVIRKVDMDNCGTLPDFGNFKISNDEMYDRYIGVASLMPFAKAVSAKSNVFDAEGNETETDFVKMMQIVIDAGYRGYVGIEFEGEGDEYEGIMKTKKLLEACRDKVKVG